METKHTSTPWTYYNNGEDFTVHAVNGKASIAYVNVYEEFEQDADNISAEQAEANAKLIAAAPDLLEALQELMNVDELDTVAMFRAQRKALSAIEKATK